MQLAGRKTRASRQDALRGPADRRTARRLRHGRAIRSADAAAQSATGTRRSLSTGRPSGARPDGRTCRSSSNARRRNAAAEHVARARQLEEQDQLSGAIAEYRLAPTSTPRVCWRHRRRPNSNASCARRRKRPAPGRHSTRCGSRPHRRRRFRDSIRGRSCPRCGFPTRRSATSSDHRGTDRHQHQVRPGPRRRAQPAVLMDIQETPSRKC